ncbi:MAG: DUF922 domain-containing protein [Rhizobiaceae bacterium]
MGNARTVINIPFDACRAAFLTVLCIGLATLLTMASATPAAAQKSSIKISEKTKYYRISGKNAADFAVSMSKRGPYSRSHRRRAWATATRDMTYQLFHRKSRNRCKVKAVRLKLKVTYEMPKLASTRGVSKRHRSKWKKMYNLLNKHERTHGLYYKQFARKVYASLRKMKSAKSCSALEKKAAKIVDSLAAADKKRNVRFDRRDRRNYLSMERLYSGA